MPTGDVSGKASMFSTSTACLGPVDSRDMRALIELLGEHHDLCPFEGRRASMGCTVKTGRNPSLLSSRSSSCPQASQTRWYAEKSSLADAMTPPMGWASSLPIGSARESSSRMVAMWKQAESALTRRLSCRGGERRNEVASLRELPRRTTRPARRWRHT